VAYRLRYGYSSKGYDGYPNDVVYICVIAFLAMTAGMLLWVLLLAVSRDSAAETSH